MLRSPSCSGPALPRPPPASLPTTAWTCSAGTRAPVPPTDNDEDFPLDVGLDVDATAALRVVSAAQAGDVHHAALVHVHHAGCEGRGARLRLGLIRRAPPTPPPRPRWTEGRWDPSVLPEAAACMQSPHPTCPKCCWIGLRASIPSSRRLAHQPTQDLGECVGPQPIRKQPSYQRPLLSKCTYCHISSPGG